MKTCVIASLVLFVAASPEVEETRHQVELREHYHHLSYIAEYSCHHPQPRTVPVHELLSPYQTRGKAYFPEYTVLHRCDVFSGCCEGAKKCGPVHAHNVHLPFKVTYLEDMGDKHKGEWVMEYVSLDNHTICSCIDHHDTYYHTEVHYVIEDKDHHKHEDHDHKDHYEHEDHDHKDHHEHEEHDHKDHIAIAEAEAHKDHAHAEAEAHEDHAHAEAEAHKDHEYRHVDHDHHYAHKDHDHHYAHEDHDHKDHYGHEEYEHKYSRVDYKYPYVKDSAAKDSVVKDSIAKESISKEQNKPEDELYNKAEKMPAIIPSNKKIDSLFITI